MVGRVVKALTVTRGAWFFYQFQPKEMKLSIAFWLFGAQEMSLGRFVFERGGPLFC